MRHSYLQRSSQNIFNQRMDYTTLHVRHCMENIFVVTKVKVKVIHTNTHPLHPLHPQAHAQCRVYGKQKNKASTDRYTIRL